MNASIVRFLILFSTLIFFVGCKDGVGKGNATITITTKEDSHSNSATIYVKSGMKMNTLILEQQ